MVSGPLYLTPFAAWGMGKREIRGQKSEVRRQKTEDRRSISTV